MEFGQFYQYKNGTLAAISEPAEQEVGLAVADSFLVQDGKMRGRTKHLERFTNGVKTAAPEYLDELPQFFEAAFALIPRTGDWFPRFEVHLGTEAPHQLYFRLRTAPEIYSEATVWTLPEPDPRANQSIKGPDLSLGQQLRRKAKMHGADEAVLLDIDGHIIEGALSAIVWWRGDTLCAPGDDVKWLPSVTRELIFEIAKQSQVETSLELAKPQDLIGCEVWLLSALQGIRPVTNWIDLGGELAKPTRVEAFGMRLRMLSQQLD